MQAPYASCYSAVFLVIAACGGSAFSVGSDSGANNPSAQGPDAAATVSGVACGGSTCSGTTPVCCAGASPTCAHQECGCETQLECASEKNCPITAPFCCIDNRSDLTCSAGHFISRCAPACLNGSNRLCSPAAVASCGTGVCTTDPGDLSGVGLPANAGFGVCK
jgi:hypothetical protein